MRKLASILIIIAFSSTFGIASESELDFSNISKTSYGKKSSLSPISNPISHYEELGSNHCPDRTAHCQNHCSGLHYATISEDQVQLDLYYAIVDKRSWYLSDHYRTPTLEPAIKPPVFS